MAHLFVLDQTTIDSLSNEDVAKTVADLKELGLYKLPYPDCWVQIPMTATKTKNIEVAQAWYNSHAHWRKCFEETPDGYKWCHPGVYIQMNLTNGAGNIWSEGTALYKPFRLETEPYECQTENVKDILIALLACKNVMKSTRADKLARLGIGRNSKRRQRFTYTTTISIPVDLPDDDEHPAQPGKPKCPHMRRGHIRRQKYGPRFQFTRKVYIEPCIVNACADFVSARDHYNVTLSTKPETLDERFHPQPAAAEVATQHSQTTHHSLRAGPGPRSHPLPSHSMIYSAQEVRPYEHPSNQVPHRRPASS